ncbi:MAG TPA: EAL domain-containing protein [Paucimonas sp.]|nr:EAL domain-containing protein [Paucimonas sp.]
MSERHFLLRRQLKKLGIDPESGPATAEQWARFLERVDRAYTEADNERYLLERSQEISSREMRELYLHVEESQRIAGLGNWSFDRAGKRGLWSKECFNIFGMEPTARIPAYGEFLKRVHQGDRQQFNRRIRAALRHCEDFEVEFRYHLADGNLRWVRVKGQPLCGTEGKALRLRGTVMDVTSRKQVEQRQTMEHTITRMVAESDAPDEVMPEIVRIIGETLDWACGAEWRLDRNTGSVQRASTWSAPDPRIATFYKTSKRSIRRASQHGLIGRTLLSTEPVWHPDVSGDAHFLRGDAARRAGLHTAFAFPIRAGSEVFGVVEFFHTKVQDADPEMLQSAQSIGRLLAQFFQRKQARDALRESEIHFQHLAFHDTLTDLPNRAMFNRHLTHAITQAERYNKGLAVLFIDLDRFKNINDTLGHDAGDRLLQEMARRITSSVRSGDVVTRTRSDDGMVARLGGDEFVVLLEEVADPARVAQIARRLLSELVREFPLDGQILHMTASIGISMYPQDGTNEFSLMKHADIAMYRAKDRGKNNFQFYSAHMDQHSAHLLALEAGLRRALERRELLLHYQAKVETLTGRIIGAEALVRWQHPEFGLMAPMQFIPTAEESGLILPLSQWVLREACRQSVQWRAAGLPPLPIAVNLSPRQFVDEDIVEDTKAILAETGMDPSLLEFEITESMMMHNAERTVQILTDLRGMGIHIAIDDFGIGYSSLSHLKQFPIDILKIDRSFIGDIPADKADAAITEAIIAIGKSLKITVVAEGVETLEQLQFLSNRNCDHIQGYLFSRPLPAAEFAALLQKSLVLS